MFFSQLSTKCLGYGYDLGIFFMDNQGQIYRSNLSSETEEVDVIT